jgi:hypothetical protein
MEILDLLLNGNYRTGQLLNIHLKNQGYQVKEVAKKFESINFFHVYREQNMQADRLSKRDIKWQKPGKYMNKAEMGSGLSPFLKTITLDHRA